MTVNISSVTTFSGLGGLSGSERTREVVVGRAQVRVESVKVTGLRT